MDHEQEDALIEIIGKLLGDRSVMVISSAGAAFNAVCPDRFDVIHTHFRKICHLLSDLDEWGQQIMLNILVRYSRANFLEPPERQNNFAQNNGSENETVNFSAIQNIGDGVTQRSGAIPKASGISLQSFYGRGDDDDEEDSSSGSENETLNDAEKGDIAVAEENDDAASGDGANEDLNAREIDPDLKLFLRCMLPMLNGRNSGVIITVATTYVYLGSGSPTIMANLGSALVRELRRPPSIRSIVLGAIRDIAKTQSTMFLGRLRSFFISFQDSLECRKTKLEIISLLANRGNVTTILKEFESYLRESNVEFLSAVIRCIGRIAERVPGIGPRCLNGLLVLVHSPAAPIVAATVIVIRQLLQQAQQYKRAREEKEAARGRPASPSSTGSDLEGDMDVEIAVKRLVRMLNVVDVPTARASLVWILGEFQVLIPKRAPDILRQLAKGFCEEHVDVKMQIVNAAVKLSLRQPKKKVLGLLRTYIIDLARCATKAQKRSCYFFLLF
jgi:AP-3 complex subunit beta